ncbi:MAG: MarR family winged helix-turn-helix transcriptional regulator [Bacteroidota bacterium]
MKDRLESGIALLKHWEEYSQQDSGGDLSQFGAWLQLEYQSQKEDLLQRALSQAPKEVQGSPNLLDAQISFTWGRLMRFTQIWAKRAFAETPIRTLDEFGILMYIWQNQTPKKSEVAHHSLMEQTTCFEIIKRFQRQNLVEEFPDESDKRSRRVRLTPEALQMVGTVLRHKAETLSTLLLGRMSQDQKMVMWDLLRSLERFHTEVLDGSPEATIEEIVADNLT